MDKQHLRNWRETYAMAKPYITQGTVGIDVGCREGGFSAQMEQDFKHIFAFDFRNTLKYFTTKKLNAVQLLYKLEYN